MVINRQIPQMNRIHHPEKDSHIQPIDFQERTQCNSKEKGKYIQQTGLDKLNKHGKK